MQDTSLDAWQKIQRHLPMSQYQVLQIITEATKNGFDMTDAEVAKALHWEINRVTPRRGELQKQGLIFKAGKRQNPKSLCMNYTWKARLQP